jgi:hypothetical protein
MLGFCGERGNIAIIRLSKDVMLSREKGDMAIVRYEKMSGYVGKRGTWL